MLVPLELSIVEVIEVLETNETDPNLQAANLALHEALEKVADFVDGLNGPATAGQVMAERMGAEAGQ
jgi:hypothetical protein